MTDRFWVYVIELRDSVGDREGNKPWVYVGQSACTPEVRFQQHLDGYRASRWARDHGERLRPDLYKDQPILRTRPAAERYERDLAGTLKLKGYSIKGGH